MDKIQDGHAAQEVRQLHPPVELQDEYRVMILSLRSHIQVPEEWADHVEQKSVQEVEEADQATKDLCDFDETRLFAS